MLFIGFGFFFARNGRNRIRNKNLDLYLTALNMNCKKSNFQFNIFQYLHHVKFGSKFF